MKLVQLALLSFTLAFTAHAGCKNGLHYCYQELRNAGNIRSCHQLLWSSPLSGRRAHAAYFLDYSEKRLVEDAASDGADGGGNKDNYIYKCGGLSLETYVKYCQYGCVQGAVGKSSYCLVEPGEFLCKIGSGKGETDGL